MNSLRALLSSVTLIVLAVLHSKGCLHHSKVCYISMYGRNSVVLREFKAFCRTSAGNTWNVHGWSASSFAGIQGNVQRDTAEFAGIVQVTCDNYRSTFPLIQPATQVFIAYGCLHQVASGLALFAGCAATVLSVLVVFCHSCKPNVRFPSVHALV